MCEFFEVAFCVQCHCLAEHVFDVGMVFGELGVLVYDVHLVDSPVANSAHRAHVRTAPSTGCVTAPIASSSQLANQLHVMVSPAGTLLVSMSLMLMNVFISFTCQTEEFPDLGVGQFDVHVWLAIFAEPGIGGVCQAQDL